MVENKTAKNRPFGFSAYLASGGLKFWLLALATCLLIPPLGFALAVYLIFRAVKGTNRTNYLLISLLMLVLVYLGALAYWEAYTQWYKSGLKYSYSSLETYKLPATQTGANNGVTFSKPKEFVASYTRSQSAKPQSSLVMLIHYRDNSKKQSLAWIEASSTQTHIGKNSANYINSVDSLMQSHKGSAYESFKKSLQQFLTVSTPKDYAVEMDNPVKLHTSNIAKNAWQFNFTATSKGKSTGYKPGQVGMEGKLIMVITDKSSYYFVINSAEENWQANQKIWQQVINSFKIDQN